MVKRNTRRQNGGAYSFGASITPGLVNNYGQEVVAGPKLIPDCGAAVKSDVMGYSGPKGLPGLSGGKRRRNERKSRKQTGGSYGFVSAEGAAPAAPWAGGLAPMTRIPSETANTITNPYNPTMNGGAMTLSPAPVGGDNQAYYAPTAGYSNQASTWVGSTGSPSTVQVPYEARAMNPACLKTGGGRRRSNKRRATTRKSRSNKSRSNKSRTTRR